MNLQEILTLMDRFDASGLSKLALTEGDWMLELQKGELTAGAPLRQPAAPSAAESTGQTGAPAAPAPVAEEEEDVLIRTPLLGTFYIAREPGSQPFVKPGDTIKTGQTICVLEAMKMLSQLPAPMDCTLLEVLAEDGSLVEYDAPLFRVKPLTQ